MNAIKLALFSTVLVSGIANAATPCDGFEIKVKNNLSDNLMIRKIHLNGADIQPAGIQTLNGKSEEVFTVNKTNGNVPMKGELIFNTISLPSKQVKIKFNLTNQGLICEHEDHSPKSELSLEKTRIPGRVNYTIGN